MLIGYIMVKIAKRPKVHFRIEIYDKVNKKTKTISLTNHDDKNLEDIKEMIVRCFETEE